MTKTIMDPRPLLSPEEEVACLKNLLSDPDDDISRRLLQLHYEDMEKSAHTRSGSSWDHTRTSNR